MTDIPYKLIRAQRCKMCCVDGNIYLCGGHDGDARRVTEYNPQTDTWRKMPSLQQRKSELKVCTLDRKIFALGDPDTDMNCEMLDLSEDDLHWRYIASPNTKNLIIDVVVINKKIYVLAGDKVEVYDEDQGK